MSVTSSTSRTGPIPPDFLQNGPNDPSKMLAAAAHWV